LELRYKGDHASVELAQCGQRCPLESMMSFPIIHPFMKYLSFLILALFFVCIVSFATVVPDPPTAEDVTGAWIGFTSDANDVYRVVLNPVGGFFAHSFCDAEPMLYRIDSWTLDKKSHITFKMSPISEGAYPVLVVGRMPAAYLQLTIRAPDGGWSNNVSLYKEAIIKSRIANLSAVMERTK
jgi:hypothetical protein